MGARLCPVLGSLRSAGASCPRVFPRIWAGAFIAPWDWRHRGPTTVILGSVAVPIDAQSMLLPSNIVVPSTVTGCAIKGNISRNDERNGERWFCTEDEARAAGWRKARR